MDYYLKNVSIRRVAIAAALDALCFIMAAAAAWALGHPPVSGTTFAAATGLATVACFVALYYCDAYRPAVLGHGLRTRGAILNMMALAFVASLAIYFLVPAPRPVMGSLALVAALYFPLLLLERATFRLVSSRPRFSRRVVIIGASELGLAIAKALLERRNVGLELVGFLSDEIQPRQEPFGGFPVIGRVHEIEKLLEDLRIGTVVVASKSRREYFPADELLAAKLRGVRVESGVSFYERVTGRIYLRDLRPSYLIFSEGFQSGVLREAVKRSFDAAAATVALVVAAPALSLCALAIKLDSRGPVFFRQRRVGLGGREFECLKLRSMFDDAESQGPRFATSGDDRITRVGRVLRKARLDEVPQLWNVLKGDMSFVGPRPERPEFVDTLSERYPYFRLRCAVKPGVTGWAQIRHGYVSDVEGFEEKLALDLYYMKYRSTAMDLLILWQTVKTIILLRGV